MTERIIYGREFYKAPNSSEVVIQPGLFQDLSQRLSDIGEGKQITLVTDANVIDIHGQPLLRQIQKSGLEIGDPIIVPPGEESKNIEQYSYIVNELGRREYGRNTMLVALGGGMIGDLTGFVAATYKRGVPFVQVPTTLLAQVDSSIGGKTGIDTEYGKNLVGRFELPLATYIDPELLTTLPQRELISGLGEVIKYGALDKELFERLEKSLPAILSGDLASLNEIISRCVSIKTKTVDVDPQDKGIRQGLNLGHTIGHGLEEASNFGLSHGEAISIGMRYEGMIAVEQGIFESIELNRLLTLLEGSGLPTSIPHNFDIDTAISYMRNDKKNTNSAIKVAVPSKFGSLLSDGYRLIDVSEQELKRILIPSGS